jgi:hypothetical protein
MVQRCVSPRVRVGWGAQPHTVRPATPWAVNTLPCPAHPCVQSDRSLDVPGESLPGVLSARAFVNWYNGHPEFVGLDPGLAAVEDVVIVGNGNVAVDCARILCKQPSELEHTDIAQHALEALRHR